jgi:hypothetical protein
MFPELRIDKTPVLDGSRRNYIEFNQIPLVHISPTISLLLVVVRQRETDLSFPEHVTYLLPSPHIPIHEFTISLLFIMQKGPVITPFKYSDQSTDQDPQYAAHV